MSDTREGSPILKQLGIAGATWLDGRACEVVSMLIFEYPVTLAADEGGGFVVSFHDFPEAVAQGDTEEEALEQVADSLEEAVANRIVMRLDLPQPSAAPQAYSVALPSSTAVKAALYQVIRNLNMTKVELAALLGVDEKKVRRLLDPYHPSKLNRIEELMKRMGQPLVVGVQSPRSEQKSEPVWGLESTMVWGRQDRGGPR